MKISQKQIFFKKNFNTLILLWSYLKPYKIQLLRAILALTIAAFLILGSGKGIQYLIDDGFSVQDLHRIEQGMISCFIFSFLLAGASYIRLSTTAWISEQVVADLRQDLFYHILHLNRTFFESAKVGELMARLETDMTYIRIALSSSVAVYLRSLIQFSGAMIFLILTSPKLFGMVLLIAPFSLIPLIVIGRKTRSITSKTQKNQDFLSAYSHEILLALSTVQAFCQELTVFQRYRTGIQSYLSQAQKRVRLRALMIACIIGLILWAIILVLWLGIQDVFHHRLSIGVLASFIFYAIVAAGSLNSFNDVAGDIKSALEALERIFDLKQQEPLPPASISSSTLPVFLSLEFKDITFCYPTRPEQPALKNLSFKINQGQTFALVGASGAGKSTLFHLLQRFYEPQEGLIYLNDQDIRSFPLEVLRRMIAIVPQDPPLLNASLWENIAFSRPQALPEEILQAAQLSYVDTFATHLPQGFETIIGERGMRLSGGQKQRIALARAALYQAPLLLLDEATNALDAQSEHQVQKALDEAFKDRTRLVIAHRLSTVIKANKILVLEQGQIVDSGTHQDLLAQSQMYQHLAIHQFQGKS